MISASDLVHMRIELEKSLPDSCQIQRATKVSDGAGGSTETWATVATVACRIGPTGRQPEERAIADRLTNLTSWTLTVPALTDARVSDRLVVGSRVFEVAGVLARSHEIARRIVCIEVA